MITIGEEKKREVAENDWQAGFLAILPQIERHLACAFRRLNPEAREDAIQEGTVSCLKAYVRLFEQGRLERAFPTALARFAVRHIKSGRTVGCRLNVRDPLSRYAQIRKRIHVQRLDRYCRESGQDLAIGFTTNEAAKKQNLSPGRISQIRRELYRSWLEFHGAASNKLLAPA